MSQAKRKSANAPAPAAPAVGKAVKQTPTVKVKARVFLVDDHPMVRQGLGLVLSREADLEVCGEAGNAAEALQQIKALNPDLVITDITLQEGNGIELVRDIKARHEGTRMLVSSMHDEALYAERALRAGALGYISKEASREQLLEAVRQVLQGKIYLSDTAGNRLLSRVVDKGDGAIGSSIDTLSNRELAVFEMIGQGLSTRQIAEKLYLSVKTIETYREHLKTKLKFSNSTELVRHAVRRQFERDEGLTPRAANAVKETGGKGEKGE